MTKNTEEAIQQVLNALRDSEAPAGMERRILEALEARASVKSASRTQWLRSLWVTERPAPWKTAAWGAALAATMASCLAVLMIHRTQQHTPAQADMHPAPVAAPSPVTSAKTSQLPLSVAASRVRTKPPAHKPPLIRNDEDSLAMRQTLAASRPESPLPLTDQEKLLLRIAHRYSPEELAALDPAKWAALDAKERAEFEKFFDHQQTGDNE